MSIDKAKKLRRLAEGGYKEEKTAAQKAFDRYIKKHGIRIEDLDDNEKKDQVFRYKNGQKRLLIQIIAHITNGPVWDTRGRGNAIIGNCTKFEAIEVRAMYSYYSNLFKDELEILMTAFIDKHNLYRRSPKGDSQTLSLEEKQRIWRAIKMKDGLKDSDYFKQLED